jgi:hypothetical protein
VEIVADPFASLLAYEHGKVVADRGVLELAPDAVDEFAYLMRRQSRELLAQGALGVPDEALLIRCFKPGPDPRGR